MNSNKIKIYKQKLRLTSRQREILVGLLLGDGHLETQNEGITYRLKIEYCVIQKDYVGWLYENFKDWVLTPPQVKQKKSGQAITENLWFNTVSHIALRYYGKQFYQNGRKIVPKNISKLLKPLTLAVWFMDDGSLKSKDHRALILNTQGFNINEIEILQNGLKRIYSIESQMRNQKDGVQIMMVGDSAIEFSRIISPYLLPQFHYKLGKIGLTLLPKR
jgi:recombination protein RecA